MSSERVSGAGGRVWNIVYRSTTEWSRERGFQGCKKGNRKIEREKMLERCAEKSQLIVEVEKEVGWSKLWDSVIDLGPKHVRGLQNLSRMFSAHGRGNRPCPLCDEELEGLLVEHIMEEHQERLNLEMMFEIMMERLKMVDLNFVCVFYWFVCASVKTFVL